MVKMNSSGHPSHILCTTWYLILSLAFAILFTQTVNGQTLDFGVALNTYNTLSTSNGARHIISANLYQGTVTADAEFNATVGATADGDDLTGDDENADLGMGNASAGFGSIVVGANGYSFPLFTSNNATATDANVYGWIDFDGNGTFDADEVATAVIPADFPVLYTSLKGGHDLRTPALLGINVIHTNTLIKCLYRYEQLIG